MGAASGRAPQEIGPNSAPRFALHAGRDQARLPRGGENCSFDSQNHTSSIHLSPSPKFLYQIFYLILSIANHSQWLPPTLFLRPTGMSVTDATHWNIHAGIC